MKTTAMIALSLVAAGAQAEITTMDYTVAMTGTESSAPDLSGAVNFSGTLTAQLVIDNTLQILDSYSVTLNMNNGGGISLSYLSSPVQGAANSFMWTPYEAGGDGSAAINSTFTDALINENNYSNHRGPFFGLSIGGAATVDYNGVNYSQRDCAGFCSVSATSGGLAGTWKATTQAPEMDPATAGSAITLLLGGVMMLRRRP